VVVGVLRRLKEFLVLECGNILGGGGESSRDILYMKWAMDLRFISGMMLGVGINY
jgi:hypothetical protein